MTEGGVLKSTDSGANWTPKNSGLSHLLVRAVVADPVIAGSYHIGTWEGGVYRSTNHGENWAQINSGLSYPYILSLAIDPTNASILYAGTEGGGVYKTSLNSSVVTTTSTSTSSTSTTASSSTTSTSTTIPVRTAWAFLLYLSGDNDLKPYFDTLLNRLEASPPNPNLKVLVLYDGHENNDSKKLIIQPNGNYTDGVNRWKNFEAFMGDRQTLSDFISWARQKAPADHYYLAIAGHGRGTSGIAYDFSSTYFTQNRSYDLLTPAELNTALATATDTGQWKIDVLHYDACLMGMLENAYQVKNYASYLIASQNLGWSSFVYDRYAPAAARLEKDSSAALHLAEVIAAVQAGTTPLELAGQIVDKYFSSTGNLPATIAALDLSRISAAHQAVNNLANLLIASLDSIKERLTNIRAVTQKLDSRDYYKLTETDEYVDLYHLAQKIVQVLTDKPNIQTAAQEVMNTLANTLVLKERHRSALVLNPGSNLMNFIDLDNTHGLSIYFPPRSGSKDYTDYVGHQIFPLFTSEGQWDNFLAEYFLLTGLSPETPVDPGIPPLSAPPLQFIYLPVVSR